MSRRDPGDGGPRVGAVESLDLAHPRPERAPVSRRRRWRGVAVVLAALLLAGLAVAVVHWREAISERLIPDSTLNRQIEAAEQALAAGRLSAADGSGARERFQAVLARDPDHLGARRGLARVRDAAVRQAHEAIAAGDAGAAREAMALARALAVPEAELSTLAEALQQLDSDAADVSATLERAREDQAQGRADAALAGYERVLQRQPENALALEGRRDLLAGRLARAEALLQAGDLAAARALVDDVVARDPSHLALPALKAALGEAEARAEAARGQRLAAAGEALRRGRLDEAATAFQAELARDPELAEARAGLQQAAERAAAQAARLAADFEFEAAEARLAQARDWAPDSPAVAAAAERLQRAREVQPVAAGDPSEVAPLLAEARAAMQRGDLIEPPGTSAWDRLRLAARIAGPGDARVRAAQAEYDRRARACFEDALAGNRLSGARTCLDALGARDPMAAALAADRRRLADRYLAVAHERLGASELAAARQAWQAASALDPDNPGLPAMAERIAQAARR